MILKFFLEINEENKETEKNQRIIRTINHVYGVY